MKTLLLTLLVCIGTSLGNDFPPMPRVVLNSTILHKCNAFFFESKSLITTATCVSLCPDCPYRILLSHKEFLESNSKMYDVIKVEIHPNYTTNPDKFNVAKLFLSEAPSNAVVFKLAKTPELEPQNGTLPTWRFDNNMDFALVQNPALFVHREIYHRATGVYLRGYQISVMSFTPLTTGPFDEGSPFFVKLNDAEPPTVYGFLSKPKTQADGRFFSLMSVPYLLNTKFLSGHHQ